MGVSQWPWDRDHSLMYGGRSLPWLKEVQADSVWHRWDVNYRDVIILDSENVPVGVFNLSRHNLRDQVEYDTLRDLLIEKAE